MHIPSADTDSLPILSFDEALRQSGPAAYDRSRWLYVPDFYTEYRYVLGTRGKNPVICMGINPSTAEPDRLDPTLQSVARVSCFNGFDSFLMFNVYAQRATRPDDMDRVPSARLHAENRKAFRALLALAAANGSPPTVWAAWGAIIEKRPWLLDCVRDFRDDAGAFSARWVCAGALSKRGHPHHPLYLRKDEPFRPFDIGGYLT